MQSVCLEVKPPTPLLPSSSTTTLSAENRKKKVTSHLCWCKRENPVSITHRQKEQMPLDTERAAHTGMEEQSRTSHKHLLLQVWCGLLTISMVTMGVFLTTLKPKSAEDGVHGEKPESVNPADCSIFEHLKSPGMLSFIEVTPSLDSFWQDNIKSEFSTLSLVRNSIYSTRKSYYFVYAQVTFSKNDDSPSRSVILKRNAKHGKQLRVLAEARASTGGSVWVGRIIMLAVNDSISLNISGSYEKENTFWGAYQLH